MWSTTVLEICANFLDYAGYLPSTPSYTERTVGNNNRDKEVVLSGSLFESAVTTNVTGVADLFDSTRSLKSFQFSRLPICASSEFLLVRTEHRNFSHAALEVI